MKSKDQKIECNVESCKHLDCECNRCNLKSIKVTCMNEEESTMDNTVCSSYEEK